MNEDSFIENLFNSKDNEFIKKANRSRLKKFRDKNSNNDNNFSQVHTVCELTKPLHNAKVTQSSILSPTVIEEKKDEYYNDSSEISLSSELNDSFELKELDFLNFNQIDSYQQHKFVNEVSETEYLFQESKTTIRDFLCSLFALKYKHKLSTKVVDDILLLFKNVLPQPNSCPKNSTNAFKKRFEYKDENSKVFYVCAKCEILYEKFQEDIKICTKCMASDVETFVVFNSENQLKQLLSNKNHAKQIKEFNLYEKSCSRDESRLLHGEIYASLPRKEEFYYLSLNINTDGAPITVHNSFSMWPVLATIVELNDDARESFKNMLILGIWISRAKPVYSSFISKSIEEIVSLCNIPFSFNGEVYKIRTQALICDLPAKAAVLNVIQFNGKFGCLVCYHPGEYSSIFRKRIYHSDKKFKMRTSDEYKLISNIAEKNKVALFGIKGETILSQIISIPNQVPLDPMHLVLQGHTKWLIKNYALGDKSEDFYIGHKIDKINAILSEVKTPHTIHRKVKLLSDQNLQYKSSELRIFLFYTCVPALYKILPDSYFLLLLSYVCAIRLLYEPITSFAAIDLAEEIIENYTESLEDYFDDSAYNYTVHAHLHLAEQVRNHGPLYGHSQFAFEGALFQLKNLLHGSRGYINQINDNILLNKNFLSNLNKESFNSEDLFNVTMKIINPEVYHDSSDTQLLHPFKRKKLNNEESEIIKVELNKTVDFVVCSDRIKIKKSIYWSRNYVKRGESDSFTVCFSFKNQEAYGEIIEFFELDNSFYCFISPFTILSKTSSAQLLPNKASYFSSICRSGLFDKFYKIFERTSQVNLINCSSIICKCIIVKNGELNFLTKLMYEFEHD